MGKIGNFGKLITFEVSDKKVLTFNNFSKTVSGNWGTHERVGKKPQSEFLGPGLQQISFDIVLSANLGVKPRFVITNIEKAIEKGRVEYLVIGAKKVGSNKWKITQMSESWGVVMSKGELQRAEVSLTLEEYL
jgi:hypothetical protein